MSNYHIPILVEEVLELLNPKDGQTIIDATLGGGGHTKAIIDKKAKVIGIDQDPEAITYTGNRLDIDQSKLTLIEGNFGALTNLMAENAIESVDGILFDLGVSSHQVDSVERGFSFQIDAPLDMRMAPHLAVTAKDLVNGLGKNELYELFTKYAQEQLARPIAQAIVSARRLNMIETTGQLAKIVEKVYGRRKSHLHPATKVFQALRIAVNDELNTLKSVLPQACQLLNKGGVLVIISFHEGEDRIVKHFTRSLNEKNWQILTKKPIIPSPEEISQNPRSRSAKLRAIKKLA
jgi:16S rRNA (cytosine1402-N4)-methyltransferase